MGYTTEFEGQFQLTPAATPEQIAYINAFSGTRRMGRNANETAKLPDPLREAVGLPVGTDGEFYVGAYADNNFGQTETPDIIHFNAPPRYQPGLWCKWVLTEDGSALEWNEMEKFYDYTEWLKYLITNFFEPWGIKLNGEVLWYGEDREDVGKLIVRDNVVTARTGHILYA